MAVIRINVYSNGLSLHDSPQPVARRLRAVAGRSGPIIILVHGYKYLPGKPEFCPHKKVFGDHSQGWPGQLGFTGQSDQTGLCIALGWHARGPLRAMYFRAQSVGKHIAELVTLLRKQNPGRAVHLVAHSLGSEACLCALAHLTPGAICRMVLLTGASYASRAMQLLSTPAGRAAEVLNVTSRENDLFDAMFEHIVPSDVRQDRTIGQGISAPNAVTVQLDCPDTLAALHGLGFDVAPPLRRVCHWSAYTRPGVMRFYETFLRAPELLPLDLIASASPGTCAPRWSRLFSVPFLPAAVQLPLLRPKPDALGSRCEAR